MMKCHFLCLVLGGKEIKVLQNKNLVILIALFQYKISNILALVLAEGTKLIKAAKCFVSLDYLHSANWFDQNEKSEDLEK